MGLSHVLTTVMASSTFRISICNNSPWFLGYPTGRLRRWKNLPPPFPPSFGLVPVPPVPRKRPDGKVSHGGYMMLTWRIEIEKNDQRTANNWINDLSKFSNSSTLCEYRNKKTHQPWITMGPWEYRPSDPSLQPLLRSSWSLTFRLVTWTSSSLRVTSSRDSAKDRYTLERPVTRAWKESTEQ